MSGGNPRRTDSREIPHVAMPIGGIGTGNLAVASDGSLRQWQLHNIGNHEGALPFSFFAIRATRIEPPLDTVRILQASPIPEPTGTPLVTDDVAPRWQHDLLARHPGVSRVLFGGTYPVASLEFVDDALPLRVELEAFNPLIPLDVADSSIPVAQFTVRITNTDTLPIHGTLGVTAQNAVGWDGVSPISGVAGAGYGGNTNRVRRAGGWTSVVMENHALAPGSASAGQMVLAVDHPGAAVLSQWRDPDEFVAFLRSRALASGAFRLRLDPTAPDPQRHAPTSAIGPSAPGETWNTGIGIPFDLQPSAVAQARVLLAWHFPHRYVNFEQFGPPRPEWGDSRFWLGNHYATVYPDAQAVSEDVIARWSQLRDRTLRWTSVFADSSLDEAAATHLAAQLSTLRSPTCFRTADGRFFGFEGVLGASTVMWSGEFGGSCPLNCTHVWNYEQALAVAFPELERSMRETEFDIAQAPEGYVPHRIAMPVYLKQFWNEPIGGPEEPALDGMLGTVCKTYREFRRGSGDGWLERYWPRVVRLLDHIVEKWDPERTGLLRGIQPSTHDIDLTGLNPFMGTLWLAALRAAEEMAGRLGDHDHAAGYRELFRLGSAGYDDALFTGEYYRQVLLPGDRREFQWESGCLSDQLIGQWWAHRLDLGYLLPVEHVRTALASVVRHNLRHGFAGFDHPFRVYADGDDSGLLMCSWPHGGRPEVPTRYADEVWTGIEYQVATHCLDEGLDTQAWAVLSALWRRYDGRRRNPYNEIECGDHYARALAGWSVIDAVGGVRWDAATGTLRLRPGATGATPLLLDRGWGLLRRTDAGVELDCRYGELVIRRLVVTGDHGDIPDRDIAAPDGLVVATGTTAAVGWKAGPSPAGSGAERV
jgi:uncharacterized protein (DUF608 family)